MKTRVQNILIAGVLLAGLCVAGAADKKHLGGPKGGRLLEKTEPKAEFFLEKDHTVTITFYDAALKPVAAGEQVVTVISKKRGTFWQAKASCPRATATTWWCSSKRRRMPNRRISGSSWKRTCARPASGRSMRAFVMSEGRTEAHMITRRSVPRRSQVP